MAAVALVLGDSLFVANWCVVVSALSVVNCFNNIVRVCMCVCSGDVRVIIVYADGSGVLLPSQRVFHSL